MSQSLRELGMDFVGDENWGRALGVFAEAVRRQPADHRARMWAARCFQKMGETERAVAVLHACAEGLLKRDYLLSAIAACRQALQWLRKRNAFARRSAAFTRARPGWWVDGPVGHLRCRLRACTTARATST